MPPVSTLLLTAALGLAGAVASLVLVATILVRLPADYFVDPARRAPPPGPPALRLLRRATRNFLGLLLVGIGVVLALPFVPGPGLLAIFLGVLLLESGRHGGFELVPREIEREFGS